MKQEFAEIIYEAVILQLNYLWKKRFGDQEQTDEVARAWFDEQWALLDETIEAVLTPLKRILQHIND